MSSALDRGRQAIDVARQHLEPPQIDVSNKSGKDWLRGDIKTRDLRQSILMLRHALLDLEAELASRRDA